MKRRMWEMTHLQIEAALQDGRGTAVVVVGSTEQHGPHLPTFTDSYQAFAIGEAVAERLGALLAPPIPVGCSDHHLGFAGTISLPASVMLQIVEAYCRCLFDAGFRRVVVLSTHGGNYPPLAEGEARLRERVSGPGRALIVLSDIHHYIAGYTQAVAEAGLPAAPLPRAEVAETSIMLALHPELVAMDLAEPGLTDEIPLQRLLEAGLRAVSPNGVLGDPTGATPALGRQCIEYAVDNIVRFVAASPAERGSGR